MYTTISVVLPNLQHSWYLHKRILDYVESYVITNPKKLTMSQDNKFYSVHKYSQAFRWSGRKVVISSIIFRTVKSTRVDHLKLYYFTKAVAYPIGEDTGDNGIEVELLPILEPLYYYCLESS